MKKGGKEGLSKEQKLKILLENNSIFSRPSSIGRAPGCRALLLRGLEAGARNREVQGSTPWGGTLEFGVNDGKNLHGLHNISIEKRSEKIS